MLDYDNNENKTFDSMDQVTYYVYVHLDNKDDKDTVEDDKSDGCDDRYYD